VRTFVLSHPESKELLRRLEDFLKFVLPRYEREGKAYLTVAIGCTGGRHRSVTVAEELKRSLAGVGYAPTVVHRDCSESRTRARVSDRLAFCLGVHNHQPIGNFEHVLVEATERAYRPFLERLEARPEVRVSVHCTGSLLEWLRQRAPRTFDLLGTVAARGQVELLTGGFYEPILAVLPDHDKLGQIEKLTAFLKTHFGVRPRGMWLAERVWEPHLARVLSEAGVEYVLVDDHHFALAGHDADALSGDYLTEEQGAVLRVFPINQRLRYLIPFADIDQTLAYLESRRERATAITMVDDGEKFGVWPGTYARVYEDGWLGRFFDRLLSTSWLELTTLGDVVERRPPSDRVYLPTASYGEMG